MHGLRHGDRRATGEIDGLPVLPGGDALARAPHLHRGRGDPRRTARPGGARRRDAGAAPAEPARAVSARCSRRAASAARSTSRPSRRRSSATTSGRIEQIVPRTRNDAHRLIEECMLAANVCAADFLARAQASGAVPRARGADAGEARGAARVPRRARPAAAAAATIPTAAGLREAARARSRSGPTRAAADDAAALDAAGGLQPGQHRPLRPGLRGLRALHHADPALSRPAGAPRDQGGARRTSATTPTADWDGARARTARRTSGAPTRPRATSRPGSSATTCATTSARTSPARQRRHSFGLFVTLDELYVDGLVHITELGARLLPVRRGAPRAARRAHRQALPARRPGDGASGARRPRDRARSISCSHERREDASRASCSASTPCSRACAPTRSRCVEIFLDETRNDARAKDLAAVARALRRAA